MNFKYKLTEWTTRMIWKTTRRNNKCELKV